MLLRASSGFLLGLLFVASAGAQAPPPVADSLLDGLVGTWTMTGQVQGDSVRYDADAEWVLGHQFLRLRMTDTQRPPQYAAHVYVGYDSTTQRYVAHWLDTTGGGASTTLGTGRRTDSTLTLRFDYPDGPFRTTFERRADGRWRVRMRSTDGSGTWRPFASYSMTRAAPSARPVEDPDTNEPIPSFTDILPHFSLPNHAPQLPDRCAPQSPAEPGLFGHQPHRPRCGPGRLSADRPLRSPRALL